MNENENKPAEPVEETGQASARTLGGNELETQANRAEIANDTAVETTAEATTVPAVETADATVETAHLAPINKASWPWIAVALIAVAALVFVLVRDSSQVAGGSDNAVLGRLDGANITKVDLYDEMAKQMPKEQLSQTLDGLMMLKMIDLEAGKKGITASDADMDAEIAKYKKNFPSDEAFDNALAQSGMTMDGFKEQIVISVKLRKIFEPQINPTEDKLKKFYDDHKANYGTPEEIRASHILLATKAEAEAVLAELKNGADFATLAKEKSTDPGSKDDGGDLNYFGRGEMNEEFETAAFKLNKGEMSGVVESPNGFHIIKVTDKKPAVTPTYEEVKTQVKNDYLDQEIQGKFSDWLTAMKKEYHFENLLDPADDNATTEPTASAPAVK